MNPIDILLSGSPKQVSPTNASSRTTSVDPMSILLPKTQESVDPMSILLPKTQEQAPAKPKPQDMSLGQELGAGAAEGAKAVGETLGLASSHGIHLAEKTGLLPKGSTDAWMGAVDENTNQLRNYIYNEIGYSPQAHHTIAGTVAHGVGSFITGGGPASFIPQAVSTMTDLIQQGQTLKKTYQSGAVEAVGGAIASAIPIVGKTLGTKIATGALSATAANEATDITLNQINKNHPEIAKQFDPSDLKKLVASAVTGGITGGIYHAAVRQHEAEVKGMQDELDQFKASKEGEAGKTSPVAPDTIPYEKVTPSKLRTETPEEATKRVQIQKEATDFSKFRAEYKARAAEAHIQKVTEDQIDAAWAQHKAEIARQQQEEFDRYKKYNEDTFHPSQQHQEMEKTWIPKNQHLSDVNAAVEEAASGKKPEFKGKVGGKQSGVLDVSAFLPKSRKERYVEKVVKNLGEGYRKTAEEFWDDSHVLSEKPTTPQEGRTESQDINRLERQVAIVQGQEDAAKLALSHDLESMSPQVLADASSPEVYNSQDEEYGNKAILTPSQKLVKEQVVDKYVKKMSDLYRRAMELSGGQMPLGEDFHTARILKQTFVRRLQRFGSTVIPNSQVGLAYKAYAQRARSMFALEFENGKRVVVNQEGNRLYTYSNKERNHDPIHVSEKQLNVDEKPTVEIGGKKAKLVQAKTDEIEAATNYKYSKNALANTFVAISQLSKYIHQLEFLQNSMADMVKAGYAIPAESVTTAPHGWTRLQGHPILERYYLKDRFAQVYYDSFLRNNNPASAFEIANAVVTGSMFINPNGHMENGFIHAATSLQATYMNPLNWPRGIVEVPKMFMESAMEVSTVSPEYQKLVQSGLRLQYARVRNAATIKNALNGIPKRELRNLAKEWGYGTKPDQMISDIYSASRHLLWGSSDVFMMTAHKAAASMKGKSIFDAALHDYTETHNPGYHIPAQIGFDEILAAANKLGINGGETIALAISRGLSNIMQHPWNVFGRYHYGTFHSAAKDVRDALIQDSTSAQSRTDALKHMAAVGFTTAVIYPSILDAYARWMTGDPKATKRRAGSTTIPYVVWHMILGDKDASNLIRQAVGLTPMETTILEMLTNRDQFTGEHIYGPMATESVPQVLIDTIAPLHSIHNIIQGRGKEEMAQQMGMSVPTIVKERKLRDRTSPEEIEKRRKLREARRAYLRALENR